MSTSRSLLGSFFPPSFVSNIDTYLTYLHYNYIFLFSSPFTNLFPIPSSLYFTPLRRFNDTGWSYQQMHLALPTEPSAPSCVYNHYALLCPRITFFPFPSIFFHPYPLPFSFLSPPIVLSFSSQTSLCLIILKLAYLVNVSFTGLSFFFPLTR